MSDYLRELFDAGFEYDRRGTMMVVKAACRKCGAVHEMSLSTRLPPDQLTKKVRQLGWVDRKRSWSCKSCLMVRDKIDQEQEAPMEVAERVFNPVIVPRPEPKPDPEPKPESKPSYRQIKQAMDLIEVNFDAAAGCWRDGWSDQRVAEAAAVAVNAAVAMREDIFGKMKVPSDLTALQGDLKVVEEMVSDIKRRMMEIQKRFT